MRNVINGLEELIVGNYTGNSKSKVTIRERQAATAPVVTLPTDNRNGHISSTYPNSLVL